MNCKFGCEDSIVYQSAVTGEWHCCNCGRYWKVEDVQESHDIFGLYLPDTVGVLDDGSADVGNVQRG